MTATTAHVPPGWARVPGGTDGIPLWQWQGEPVYAATRDMDQLLFLGAALARFDHMSAEEFHEFVSSAPARSDESNTQDRRKQP